MSEHSIPRRMGDELIDAAREAVRANRAGDYEWLQQAIDELERLVGRADDERQSRLGLGLR